MILNSKQKEGLIFWLSKHTALDVSDVIAHIDAFASGEIKEWRIINEFGFAGKIWNNSGNIYVSGYNRHELDKAAYKKQEEKILIMNKELFDIISLWSGG